MDILARTDPAALESAEALREALHVQRQQYETLARTSAQTQHLLDALESLLGLDPADDPFVRVFESLRLVFTFSQAMLLVVPEEAAPEAALRCIVAEPETLMESSWPVAALFRKVLAGRVVTTFSSDGVQEWQGAAALGLSSAQSALYMPLRVRERRGMLVLLRPAGEAGFDRGHVALARRFSVLVSHALATRYASQSAAESQRLRELSEQLRDSEQEATRNAELLQQTVNVLPIGVAVQDADG
ncbi:MAG TPA: hypothetical protein VMS38_28550, partial [Pseudorhodoferax sp.]|nr:hypothetical protein [Pseudorhodoferax sp.]